MLSLGKLKLKVQIAIVIVVWAIYCLGASLAFWIESNAHARLEEAFHKDLAVLVRIPRHRELLRQFEYHADQYLLSGDRHWLKRRSEDMRSLRKINVELVQASADAK